MPYTVTLKGLRLHRAMYYFFQPTLHFRNVILLNPSGPIGDSLRLKGSRIIGIDGPPGKGDLMIDGQGATVTPGLINAHDHLELNTFKRLKYRQRYNHSRQWIEDIEARFDHDPDLVGPRRQPLTDRLLVGAVKNLLSGVTTACHHNPFHKPLRRNYPIRVVRNYGFCHSLFRGEAPLSSYWQTKSDYPWIIHLAEGVDPEAAAEFDQLERLGLLQPNTVLVHGVGLTAQQRQTLAERGGGLIWCPASNDFLFGRTAEVQQLAAVGKVALGSDSRLSGAFDLLAELRAARETDQLSPRCLFGLVTDQAAQMLRLPYSTGQIIEGGPADLVFLPPPTTSDLFAHALTLTRSQIVLVLLNGKPLVGAPRMQPVFSATGTKFAPVLVDQVEKLMPQKLVDRILKMSVREPGLMI